MAGSLDHVIRAESQSSRNKVLSEITSASIQNALQEFDELGREAFLQKYGFGKARSFFIICGEAQYDSKAIVGAARQYVASDGLPLGPADFSGGDRRVASLLRRLGFTVKDRSGIVKKRASAWLLQANPRAFDIVRALRDFEGKPIDWTARQYADDIDVDDRVYFWVAGQDRGIVGRGMIVERPVVRSQKERESFYNGPEGRFDEPELRGSVRVDQALEETVPADTVRSLPAMEHHFIFKRAIGTVFPLDDDQDLALQHLLASTSDDGEAQASPPPDGASGALLNSENPDGTATEDSFGDVPDIKAGDEFATRLDLARSGVHRATQAGITGTASAGAESIVLSGGYVDDIDDGDRIVYTGHGGRDQNTKRQIADQYLTRGNRALARSEMESLPVRVTRSVPGNGPPYRYDGLYLVVRHWHEIGRDGFRIYRFELAAVEPLVVPDAAYPEGEKSPGRSIGISSRIVRDSKIARAVKDLYKHTCQMCGTCLETATGPYAEAAHIRPLGRPANGPDVMGNVLCLCPNHHVLFDKGAITIRNDFTLVGMPGQLLVEPRHQPQEESLQYHQDHIYQDLPESTRS
jgi:putative restriction endonuclease